MNKLLKITAVIGVCAAMSSCQNGSNEQLSTADASYSTEAEISEDVKGLDEESRKLIKSADVKMRVDDVNKTTFYLEQLTKNSKGLIMKSEINNEINQTQRFRLSSDSIREAKSYTTYANIIVRIPQAYLDSFLYAAYQQSDFLDQRNRSMEDATFQYLSKQLKNQDINNVQFGDKALAKSKETEDVLATAEYLNNNTSDKIDRKITMKEIDDQVNFANISIALYQPSKVDFAIIQNVSEIMQPSFADRMTNAMSNGWKMIQFILVALMNIWPVIFITLVVIVLYSYRKKLMIKI